MVGGGKDGKMRRAFCRLRGHGLISACCCSKKLSQISVMRHNKGVFFKLVLSAKLDELTLLRDFLPAVMLGPRLFRFAALPCSQMPRWETR